MGFSAANTVQSSNAASSTGPRILGIPYGDFGLFATLLISVALGFVTFFAVTFCSIFSILLYNAITHHAVDPAHGYKYVAFPAGCLVLLIALFTLGGVWLRRRLIGR